jgi:ATP-dependent DNA helicase Q1
MDRRDIVCVMPTGILAPYSIEVETHSSSGGGKSLTYQLPAILSQNQTTLVISPLIALISDQIMHLREAGGMYMNYLRFSLTDLCIQLRLLN